VSSRSKPFRGGSCHGSGEGAREVNGGGDRYLFVFFLGRTVETIIKVWNVGQEAPGKVMVMWEWLWAGNGRTGYFYS